MSKYKLIGSCFGDYHEDGAETLEEAIAVAYWASYYSSWRVMEIRNQAGDLVMNEDQIEASISEFGQKLDAL